MVIKKVLISILIFIILIGNIFAESISIDLEVKDVGFSPENEEEGFLATILYPIFIFLQTAGVDVFGWHAVNGHYRGLKKLVTMSFEVYLPYYKDAEEILMYNPNGQEILRENIKENLISKKVNKIYLLIAVLVVIILFSAFFIKNRLNKNEKRKR